jgi:hypothetical protein
MTLANASVIVTAHMHAYGQYKLKSQIESRINLLCASVVPFRSTIGKQRLCNNRSMGYAAASVSLRLCVKCLSKAVKR